MQRAPILIVDNNPAIREVLAETLHVAGHDGVPAEDGQKALELAQIVQSALIVTVAP